MKIYRFFSYAASLTVLLALVATPAFAAGESKERDLGGFGSWRTYAYDEGGQSVCYMVTTKTIKSNGPAKRTVPYLMITHRPIEASTDVFSYGAGALLDAKHGVRVEVGKNDFDLFSVRDTAWARDSLTDHKLATALRDATNAQVSGISSQNRVATISDVFDLTGAPQAYRAINKACGLPDVDSKKPVVAKAVVKKAASKKVVSKNAVSKKSTAKRPAAKKVAARKPVVKKTSAKSHSAHSAQKPPLPQRQTQN